MRQHGALKLAAVTAGIFWTAWTNVATASSGIDSPDSGVEQAGRGSAWLARADDPLAAYFNPAAMAFQATGVHVGAQLMMSNKCFTRETIDPSGKVTAVPPDWSTTAPSPLLPGQAQPTDGSVLPSGTICSNSGAFPNPQLGAVFRLSDRWALGLAVVAPHAAGNADWGEQLTYTGAFNGVTFPATMPSPQRYLLAKSDALIVNPTIAVAFAPTENLSFGAAFIWGIATAEFVNFAEALSIQPVAPNYGDHALNDIKAAFKTKDLFIPGFALSGLWSPSSNLDLAAWFKWQDALHASGDLRIESSYWTGNKLAHLDDPCKAANDKAGCNITSATNAGTINLNTPMEAKLGVRYHLPRKDPPKTPKWADVPGRRVRDPLSQDVFDVELDLTWANNSAVKDLELTFRTDPIIPINFPGSGALGSVPANANIPHHWKDVFGVRLGGDFVAVPNLLTLRTGGFVETKGQDDAYLSIDFVMGWKAGIGGGAKLRLFDRVDLAVVYQHTFFGTLDNGGKGSIYALSGDKTGPKGGDPPCADVAVDRGKPCYRSWQAVNGGILTASMNEVGLSATARF